MVSSLNKATLIGNIGKDPEIRPTKDGKEIATFSLATSEAWKDKMSGEKKEKTEWHRVVIFSQPLVAIVKNYVHKGSKLYIEGSIQTRKWMDQQSGTEKYVTEIVLQPFSSVLLLLDNKGLPINEYSSEQRSSVYNSPDKSKTEYNYDIADDEIPIDDNIPF